jgi:opacity protein-like surface antigen
MKERLAEYSSHMACSLVLVFLILSPCPGRAQGSLFYLEAQAVGGYSSAAREAIYYSMTQDDAMQKPSVGFDWLQRLSGEGRDFGVIGVQARLAYNHEPDREVELQLYNAWFRYKAGFADIWIGHDRPALGLSSYFDSHGLLLPTLAMMGWGFDRDWGAGFSRDFTWGNLAGSFTTGSGMPLYFKGNYLATARIAKGVLERDNFNLGLSAAWGDVLETMGYELMSDDPVEFHMTSIDFTYLWTRFESRLDLMVGERMEESACAFFWRFTMNLLAENRLKLEAQPILWDDAEESRFMLSAGVSYQATEDLALRAMYQYIDLAEDNTNGPALRSMYQRFDEDRDNRIVFQVYYYGGI